MTVIILFEHADFQGRSITFDEEVADLTNNTLDYFLWFQTSNWNDRASSLIYIDDPVTTATTQSKFVLAVYEHTQFEGDYDLLRPGEYSYLGDDWNDRISSFQVFGELTHLGHL